MAVAPTARQRRESTLVEAVIPTRKDGKRLPGFDKARPTRRDVVKRWIG